MTESAKSPSDMYSPYTTFTREEWSNLREVTPLTLSEQDLKELQGFNDKISLAEVQDIYLPLSRLLNLYVEARQKLYKATQTFLNDHTAKVPYIIGIAGSVAVGKSTTARVLQALLSHWPNHPKVDLVTTDGFLYPNRILEERGLMKRKGFPESYNTRKLISFLADIKSGLFEVSCPMYSHLVYDILPNQLQVIQQPDILIIEGINVLQGSSKSSPGKRKVTSEVYVSDFFDFSIYVDAKEAEIEDWYIERFKMLRNTSFSDPNSYFHRYSDLSDTEAVETANNIWREINLLNLRENIQPTRGRANLILTKSTGHAVNKIKLRKL
ncbi:type I pantothenate kinase [Paenibacillus sp. Soil750]|uniref:type I pantothenate kinase n=1 Tax=Paenibacillus sp. Soil750 TaxID=1736398 RepID=UPI0006FC13F1|nr:type I pantothenate kinase [Paenibacillus sp. Soil750]KRE57442.1 type I pantothenate kinase [Paenibacillus sp. Soil750]